MASAEPPCPLRAALPNFSMKRMINACVLLELVVKQLLTTAGQIYTSYLKIQETGVLHFALLLNGTGFPSPSHLQ